MPDGKVLTPRNPYDARMIYKNNPNSLSQAKAIYNEKEATITKVSVVDDAIASNNGARIAQPQVALPNSVGRISRSR